MLPPLTFADEQLDQGLGTPDESVASLVGRRTIAA